MDEQRYFVGTLSVAHAANWEICKATELWGSGSSSHAVHASSLVKPGDRLILWQSKKGLVAIAAGLRA